jgi:hypothetical protein
VDAAGLFSDVDCESAECYDSASHDRGVERGVIPHSQAPDAHREKCYSPP